MDYLTKANLPTSISCNVISLSMCLVKSSRIVEYLKKSIFNFQPIIKRFHFFFLIFKSDFPILQIYTIYLVFWSEFGLSCDSVHNSYKAKITPNPSQPANQNFYSYINNFSPKSHRYSGIYREVFFFLQSLQPKVQKNSIACEIYSLNVSFQ